MVLKEDATSGMEVIREMTVISGFVGASTVCVVIVGDGEGEKGMWG